MKQPPTNDGIGTSPTHVYFTRDVILANADTGPLGRQMVKAGTDHYGTWTLRLDWERRYVRIGCKHQGYPEMVTLVPFEAISSFFTQEHRESE